VPAVRGRDRELRAIANLLEQTKQGSGGMLLVEGKPGLGKSALLAEAAFAASSLGFVVAAAAADEFSRFVPAGPVLAALGQPLFWPESPDGRGEFAEGPTSVVEHVGRQLERKVQPGPLLVCLDDLQWADPATLLALRSMPTQLASYPLAWILARSTGLRARRQAMLFDLLASQGAARIRLSPLNDDAASAIVADAIGGKPDQPLFELVRGAAGNPFLITELVAGLIDERAVAIEAGVASLSSQALPKRMHAAVNVGLDRLSGRARRLLETAAVLGRSFRLEDTAAMLGTSAAELLGPVEEALVADVLFAADDALSFRHELCWRAILDGLPQPVRQALHAQFGNMLLARGSAYQAAPHLANAARADDPQALARLDRVRAAVLASSPDAAADVAVRALTLTASDDPERIARAVGAAEALASANRLGEADQVIRTTLDQPISGRHEARLRSALASVLHLRGLDSQAIDEAERVLSHRNLPRDVRGRATIAVLQALTGLKDGRRCAEIASGIRQSPRSHTRAERVAALIVLAVIGWDSGRMQESLELCEQAVRLASRKPPDARLTQARLTLAGMLVDIRRYAEAAALLSLVRERNALLNDLEASASPALLRARIDLARGRLDDAIAEAEAARQMADAHGALDYGSHAFCLLATVALRRGDFSAATDLVAGPAFARNPDPHGGQLAMGIALGRLAEATDGPHAAMSTLGETYEAIAQHRSVLICDPGAAPWLVRAALGAREPDRAARAAGIADEIALANPGFPTVSAAADHAGGILRADRARLHRAREGHEDPWLRASAAEDLAILARTHDGSVADAVACLDEALDGYQRSGAARDTARVRRRLRRIGVRRRHWTTHRRPDVGWDSLTDTERAICDLVAEGLSNREVADRKYVSVDTVALHLRRVFRKLGISTRVELARIAIENAQGCSTDGRTRAPTSRVRD